MTTARRNKAPTPELVDAESKEAPKAPEAVVVQDSGGVGGESAVVAVHPDAPADVVLALQAKIATLEARLASAELSKAPEAAQELVDSLDKLVAHAKVASMGSLRVLFDKALDAADGALDVLEGKKRK